MSESISPKELTVIQNLEQYQNQRGLARATGFSLGMTNLLLKRLVKKGYVKVVSLNGRTLRYILTPTGFAEKVRRSYEYVLVSIRYLNEVKERIRTLLEESGGDRPIWVLGQSELAGLTKEILRDQGIRFQSLESAEQIDDWSFLPADALVLVCDMENRPPLPAQGQLAVELVALVGQ